MIQVQYPDVVLLSIKGRTGEEGVAICNPKSPAMNGWHYHFYSPQANAYLLMARCGETIEGPLKEIRSQDLDGRAPSIQGRFIDADRALQILRENRISLDPADHQAGGSRPFALSLQGDKDPRFKEHPIFWTILLGKNLFMVNADTQKLLRPDSMNAPAKSGKASKGVASGTSAFRPTQPKGYTAKSDMDRVKSYVNKNMRGAILMGIDGIADARGSVACTGQGDGWAYYFYYPRTRAVEAVYSCRGAVGTGQATYVPVSLSLHNAISADFIDSDKAMESFIRGELGVMNEGLGRNLTRKASMRLLRYRASPVMQQQFWSATLLWEIEVGTNLFYVEARKGTYLGPKEKY